MSIQEKIALKSLAQRVSRGTITQAQGRIEFTKITGRDPDEVPADDDEAGQELGKLIAAMGQAYPAPSGQDPDLEGQQPVKEWLKKVKAAIQEKKNSPTSEKRTRKAKPAEKK